MGAISLKYKSKSGNLTAPGDVDPGAFIPIATTTLATAAATITFSGIPQNYEHLQIRGIGRSSTATAADVDLRVQFNGDTGNNYSIHYLYGSGSAVAAAATTSNTYTTGGVVIKDGNTANTFSTNVIDILDYSNASKNKTVRVLTGWDANGSGYIYLNSGAWLSTAAITSLTLTPWQGNFMTYSSFALYGIKRAGA